MSIDLKRKNPRYEGYLVIGKGHDIVKLPLTKLPSKFHRWTNKKVFGFTYLDADGKEL